MRRYSVRMISLVPEKIADPDSLPLIDSSGPKFHRAVSERRSLAVFQSEGSSTVVENIPFPFHLTIEFRVRWM